MSSAGYLHALKAGAEIQAMAVKPKTQERRDKAREELGAWLRQNQPSRGLRACLPEDLIVYLVSWWSMEHGGCTAPDGSKSAAPGSVESLCSHLAVKFDKRGRCGDYCPASMGGDPVQSVQLQRFRQGYAKFVASKATSKCPHAHGRNVKLLGYCSTEQAAAASQRHPGSAASPGCIPVLCAMAKQEQGCECWGMESGECQADVRSSGYTAGVPYAAVASGQ
jgi:hypothetical protein